MTIYRKVKNTEYEIFICAQYFTIARMKKRRYSSGSRARGFCYVQLKVDCSPERAKAYLKDDALNSGGTVRFDAKNALEWFDEILQLTKELALKESL